MILVIDNYDSFTYNLVQYIGELGFIPEVVRNDAITIAAIRKLHPEKIVISPGPCTPSQAGISVELIRQLHEEYPILGVCLGHQALGEAFGGRVIRAGEIVHGKVSEILHTGKGVFQSVVSPFLATRYHSLVVERSTLPACLAVTAWTSDNLIMGLQHRQHPTFGVQFHPESIATEHGKVILGNFLRTAYSPLHQRPTR